MFIWLIIVKLFSIDNLNDNIFLCYILLLLIVKVVFKVLYVFLFIYWKVFNEY